MTITNLEDAIAAAKRLPSMEKELAELRAEVKASKEPARILYEEAKAYRARCQRLEAALREIAGKENCDHMYTQHENDMQDIARTALAKSEEDR